MTYLTSCEHWIRNKNLYFEQLEFPIGGLIVKFHLFNSKIWLSKSREDLDFKETINKGANIKGKRYYPIPQTLTQQS